MPPLDGSPALQAQSLEVPLRRRPQFILQFDALRIGRRRSDIPHRLKVRALVLLRLCPHKGRRGGEARRVCALRGLHSEEPQKHAYEARVRGLCGERGVHEPGVQREADYTGIGGGEPPCEAVREAHGGELRDEIAREIGDLLVQVEILERVEGREADVGVRGNAAPVCIGRELEGRYQWASWGLVGGARTFMMRTSEPSSSDVLMSRGRRGMVNWKVPIWLRRNVRPIYGVQWADQSSDAHFTIIISVIPVFRTSAKGKRRKSRRTCHPGTACQRRPWY